MISTNELVKKIMVEESIIDINIMNSMLLDDRKSLLEFYLYNEENYGKRYDWNELFVSKEKYNLIKIINKKLSYESTEGTERYVSDSKRNRKIKKLKKIIESIESENDLKFTQPLEDFEYKNNYELHELEVKITLEYIHYSSKSSEVEKRELIDEIIKIEDSICFKLNDESLRTYSYEELENNSLSEVINSYKSIKESNYQIELEYQSNRTKEREEEEEEPVEEIKIHSDYENNLQEVLLIY